MTLPISGDLSFDAISQELGYGTSHTLGLGDAEPRALASVASGDISAADFYGKTKPMVLYSYVGVSTAGLITDAQILALPAINITTLPHAFALTAGSGQYMYFASPVSLGAIQFYDVGSHFTGGWDGAYNNNFANIGPRTTMLNGVQYYVYRTDYPNLGYVPWEAQHDASPYY